MPAAEGAIGADSERPRGLDLAESGLDVVVVIASSARDSDLAPFVGEARLGESMLVAPADASPALAYFTPMEREEAARTGLRLLTPESLEISRLALEGRSGVEILRHAVRRALEILQIEPGRLGLAGSGHAGRVYEACRDLENQGFEIISGHEVVRRARKQKTALEIAEVERAAAVTCQAFRAMAEMLAGATPREGGELWLAEERLTVGRIKSSIADVVGRAGLSQPEGGIVAPGEEGAVPHNSGTPERTLCAGESIVIDLFPKGRLFADCTRTFCVGRAPEPLVRAHAAALDTLLWSHRATRPGTSGWALQEGACERLGEAGYDTPSSAPGNTAGYVHGLGHGVGYDLHELPSFRKRDRDERDGRIENGDVLTLEPGLYDPEAGFGVRLEDLALIEDGKARNLTPLPYDLDPRAWA